MKKTSHRYGKDLEHTEVIRDEEIAYDHNGIEQVLYEGMLEEIEEAKNQRSKTRIPAMYGKMLEI